MARRSYQNCSRHCGQLGQMRCVDPAAQARVPRLSTSRCGPRPSLVSRSGGKLSLFLLGNHIAGQFGFEDLDLRRRSEAHVLRMVSIAPGSTRSPNGLCFCGGQPSCVGACAEKDSSFGHLPIMCFASCCCCRVLLLFVVPLAGLVYFLCQPLLSPALSFLLSKNI